MAGWILCKVNPDTDCVSNGRLLGRTTDCFDNNREIRMVELRVDADFMEHYVKIKFEWLLFTFSPVPFLRLTPVLILAEDSIKRRHFR